MLANKVAVITGANKGIGKAIAENFIKNNATVWLCSRKIDKNHFNKLKKNNEIFFVEFDFSNSSEVIESAKHITKNNTKIDILVNNAGIIDTSLFLMTKIDEIKNMFDINFFEQLRFTQIIIKKMLFFCFIPGSLVRSGCDLTDGPLCLPTGGYGPIKAQLLIH